MAGVRPCHPFTSKDLEAAQLVTPHEISHGIEYAAPHDDPRLKHLFLLFRQDSSLVRALSRALRPFKAVEYACIFGSFSRGTTNAKSDIDVLILLSASEQEWDIRTALPAVGFNLCSAKRILTDITRALVARCARPYGLKKIWNESAWTRRNRNFGTEVSRRD
jgi:hypothetical protein